MESYPKKDLKQPVKTVDPTTNYYGQDKFQKQDPMKPTVDKGFANMHANLFNEGNHTDTQGNSNRIDRMKAMARRMGKVQ